VRRDIIQPQKLNKTKMAYTKETKQASQDAYHEARALGHTKEESRKIRDNWKSSNTSRSTSNGDDIDGDDWSWESSEPYSQDCIDD